MMTGFFVPVHQNEGQSEDLMQPVMPESVVITLSKVICVPWLCLSNAGLQLAAPLRCDSKGSLCFALLEFESL